jgi:hypothetical protein
MLPGRLGVRFALEALFLVALAIGAGLADLRPALILLVMAVAWVLVAVIEFTAERIAASPLTYLLPARPEAPEDAPAWPAVEERTVVAPPARPPEPEPQQEVEPEPAAEPESESAPVAEEPSRRGFLRRRRPVEQTDVAVEPEPPPPERVDDTGEIPVPKRRLGARLRRRGREEEAPPPAAPRHVKLLPRRPAPPSRAADEIAELFGSSPGEEAKREGPDE